MPETAHKRQLTSKIYATPLMTPTTDLGLSIRLSMFELRETGDRDIFLGPPERARAETGGADQWVLKRRELPGFAIVNEKKRLHPWDTHHQFSIKTLLSDLFVSKGQQQQVPFLSSLNPEILVFRPNCTVITVSIQQKLIHSEKKPVYIIKRDVLICATPHLIVLTLTAELGKTKSLVETLRNHCLYPTEAVT